MYQIFQLYIKIKEAYGLLGCETMSIEPFIAIHYVLFTTELLRL